MATGQGRWGTRPRGRCALQSRRTSHLSKHARVLLSQPTGLVPAPAGHLIVAEEEPEAQRGTGTCLRWHSGSQTCDGDSAACPQTLLCNAPAAPAPGGAGPPRRCRRSAGQGCLGVRSFCIRTLLPSVSPGVPRTTTWTTPQRCCRSGWPPWAATMQPCSGGPRGSPGAEGGRGGRQTGAGLDPERRGGSLQAGALSAVLQRGGGTGPGGQSSPCPTGPTQTKRAPSTGPEKGTSF